MEATNMASILNAYTLFFQGVKSLKSTYSEEFQGQKLFVIYEEDVVNVILCSFHQNRIYADKIRFAGGMGLSYLNFSLEAALKNYVSKNAAELDHYLHFYSDFIDSSKKGRTDDNKELLNQFIKLNTSHSEWMFLAYYSHFSNEKKLEEMVLEFRPDIMIKVKENVEKMGCKW